MSLHVQVTRKVNQLFVRGQWEGRPPEEFDTLIVPVTEGETAAETVELAMMVFGLTPSWPWSKRTDSEVLEGEFTQAGSHKEVKNSNAHSHDLNA